MVGEDDSYLFLNKFFFKVDLNSLKTLDSLATATFRKSISN